MIKIDELIGYLQMYDKRRELNDNFKFVINELLFYITPILNQYYKNIVIKCVNLEFKTRIFSYWLITNQYRSININGKWSTNEISNWY